MAKSLIGPHSSISKGILEAVKYSQYIGGNTTQIFLGSNQSTSLKTKTKITKQEIEEVNKWIKENNHILIIHSVYLLNFCNYPPSSSKIKYAIDNLEYDLNLTEELGGLGCVLHIGYQKDMDRTEAYSNMAENIKHVIDITNKTASNTKVILETPAGKGTQIGTTLEEFAELWNLIPKKYYKRLGVCVDTAHIFSSGSDIRTSAKVNKYLSDFDKLVGLKHLTCFHINDSKAVLNSRKDLHEGIGEGYIFGTDKGGSLLALKEIWKFAKKNEIPMILETHSAGFYKAEKDNGKYYQEVQLFRGWDNGEALEKTFKLKDKVDLPSQDTNKLIIELLTKMQKYYQIKKDTIRANSYRKAVFQLKNYPEIIKSGNDVRELDGIGEKMASKIDEIIRTGKLSKLEKLDADKVISDASKKTKSINELSNVFGIGPAVAKKLKAEGVETINNLERVDASGKIDLTYQQKIGLQYHDNLTSTIPRSETEQIYNKIKNALKQNTDFKDVKVTIAGSYPSGKSESKDIDILLTTNRFKSRSGVYKSKLLSNIVDYLSSEKIITHTLSIGSTKFLGLTQLNTKSKHRHLDIRLLPENLFVYGYLHYTGGRNFNTIIREKAKKKGYKLSEYGLFNSDNQLIKVKSDKDIFDIIGLDYIPIENRH